MLTVFHGSQHASLHTFDTNVVNEVDCRRLGAYFTTSRNYAETYGDHVYEVTLSIENPFDIRGMSALQAITAIPVPETMKKELRMAFRGEDYSQYGLLETCIRANLRGALEAAGFDGVCFNEGYADTYVAFHADQIRINQPAFSAIAPRC